ncbi:uncharacterized protein MONOS_11597 [Monocercomonoides exilis]|uniref:uncharacterized protein n=1 Tax=Monocercomonoides exilis TaxID=2049356 RepID=UPI0035599725|nr:hypothetical protein MONOS_11597 [Monocercomonoides exilis]|eukprot:MONOS_11597.1-p1 / transcript=MONOS_11597.1 / gene=MONOS_11597 / organism=Monocercomonoides_exilis_PA203 / gene_product=unspecified product / transcript_product=unspecified product / location=Mono_scaffold00590:29058-30826(+) / protein_length=544 / sequence_SO=supercontig / SO=protein_coding / is_pseudo=false
MQQKKAISESSVAKLNDSFLLCPICGLIFDGELTEKKKIFHIRECAAQEGVDVSTLLKFLLGSMKGKDGADIDDQNLMDATLSQQNTQQNLSQPQERKSTDHRTPINLRLLRSAAKKVKEFKTASTDSEVEMQIPSSIPAFDSNTLPLNQNSTDSNNASTFSSSSNDESLNINTLIKPDTEFSNNLNESLAVGSSDIQKEKNTLPLPFPSEASVISFLSEFKNKDQPVFTPHLSCSNSLPLHANEPVRLLDSKTVSPSATSEVLFPSFATTTSPPHAIESAEKSTTPLSSSSFSSFSSNDNKSLHRRLSIHRKHSFAETRRKSPNFISSSDTNSSEESIPTSLLPDHGRQIDLSGFKFRDDSNNPDMKPNPFSRFRLQTKASIDSISSEQVSDSFERHFHQNRDTGISQKSQRKQETSFVGVNKLDDVLKVTTHAIIEIDSDSDSDSQSCQIIDFQKKEKDSDLKSNSSTTETISEKSVFSSQGNSQQLMPSFSTPPFVEQTMYISSIQSNQNPVTTPSPTQMLLAMGIDSDAHQSNDEKREL